MTATATATTTATAKGLQSLSGIWRRLWKWNLLHQFAHGSRELLHYVGLLKPD